MTPPRSIQSIIQIGLKGLLVDIECRITNGLPAIVIVGYANRSIEEAKERIRGAFNSSGLHLPRKRITLNLAPGDIPKDGTSFDLAMALAILQASQPAVAKGVTNAVVLGELSLDGTVRPIRGIISKLLAAYAQGVRHCFIPTGNMAQAHLVPGLTLFPVPSLQAFYKHLVGAVPLVHLPSAGPAVNSASVILTDLQSIAGQTKAKRALEIAAAGSHSLLLTGPPGTGKTMLARALPGILPPLQPQEVLEATQLHSLAALQFNQIISHRPFRNPHHSCSLRSLLGSDKPFIPGEISLSHHGVLFLDELAEFRRANLEALRQPIEDGFIGLGRGQYSQRLPATFLLVAATNPCPCGYFEELDQPCRCSANRIAQYQRKLSGPILDRIDLSVRVEPTDHQRILSADSATPTSTMVRQRVMQAQTRQRKRQGHLNGQLDNQAIKRHAQLTQAAEFTLNLMARKHSLSARAYLNTVTVARTIADLTDAKQIQQAHMREALELRYRAAAPL